MAKKKRAARPGYQTTIRVSDSEERAFSAAADFEGFPSIAAWMLEQARIRAGVVNKAIETGEYIEARGKKIPLADLPEGVTVREQAKR
jgi:hypothetical protein